MICSMCGRDIKERNLDCERCEGIYSDIQADEIAESGMWEDEE